MLGWNAYQGNYRALGGVGVCSHRQNLSGRIFYSANPSPSHFAVGIRVGDYFPGLYTPLN